MAMAIPTEMTSRIYRLGGAFAVGGATAAAVRTNPAVGTLVTNGLGALGLIAALTMRGPLAELGEGAAAAAAANVGSTVVGQLWPATPARLIASGGGPRVNLLPAGRVANPINARSPVMDQAEYR